LLSVIYHSVRFYIPNIAYVLPLPFLCSQQSTINILKHAMFKQTFKNIDDILYKATEAELTGKRYTNIIAPEY